MHDVGMKVVGALQEEFPDLSVTGREQDYGNRLGVTFVRDERRFVAYTPKETDYRRFGYQIWLHRFKDILARK